MIFLNNNDYIKNLCEKLGVYEVGFSRIDGDLPYAITIVVPLSKYIVNQIGDKPTHQYFHHYRTVNTFIDNTLLKIGMEIANRNYNYLPVASSQSIDGYKGYFSHKTAARLAGLGFIGKNAMFISERYGIAVRLGTLLTDMPFTVGTPIQKDCGDCNLCKNACPAMAISGVNYKEGISREEMFDPNACSEYMKKAFQHIGRGAVCGICIKNCRYFNLKNPSDS